MKVLSLVYASNICTYLLYYFLYIYIYNRICAMFKTQISIILIKTYKGSVKLLYNLYVKKFSERIVFFFSINDTYIYIYISEIFG